ncbi:glycosyltransferase family 61 protein [Nocardioides rubriscoriae]|uniref:glycosyltransferase family 61 protein n=1 Tax=Nocardioides rubriscoriae TaxID=642762 RepID=UPI0011DF06CE|nr:glycosyltransferase 61 family protein [Nocardioides rubriscoriae]
MEASTGWSAGWSPAETAYEPTGDPVELVTVDEAVVTGFAQGPLRTEDGPQRWIRGAVHDADGTLVRASQRRWHGDRLNPIAADPEQVDPPTDVRRLEGTWLYAGHVAGHFGHFLLEHLTNLWPDPADLPPLAGVLAHRPARGPLTDPHRRLQTPRLAPWQHDLMTLAGYDPAGLRVVHGRDLRVERLVVPSRPVLLKRWAHEEAVRLWQRVSGAVGTRGPDRRVYLSRTRFHAEDSAERARTEAEDDARLDARFAAAGFAVVHPETLSIAEQVAAVRGAEVLAGLSGSALHLSVFAAPGTRVLTLGDRRSPTRPTKAQVVVDAACGHETAFVADGDHETLDRLLVGLDR